jgi:hypothetical protein
MVNVSPMTRGCVVGFDSPRTTTAARLKRTRSDRSGEAILIGGVYDDDAGCMRFGRDGSPQSGTISITVVVDRPRHTHE